MLQRRDFYSKKNAFFVAMCDFGHLVPVFALVICDVKTATVTPDAHTCARAKQRAVPRPMMPHDGTPCRGVTPGGGAMFRRDIWGEFYGEKCGAINPTKSNALRECFLQ